MLWYLILNHTAYDDSVYDVKLVFSRNKKPGYINVHGITKKQDWLEDKQPTILQSL